MIRIMMMMMMTVSENFSIEKVSDSVSENFGIGKKFRFRFRSDFWFRHSLHYSLVWYIIVSGFLEQSSVFS